MAFTRHFFIFIFLITAICVVDYFYIGTSLIGIDDGNIFLNYAKHFANGDGFVFNTNGERVEGFTSLLWVLICAFFYLITSHPEVLLIILCLVLTTATVTMVYAHLKLHIDKLFPALSKYYLILYCFFILAIGPSYFAWSVMSLMENSLWNFLFTAIVINVVSTNYTNDISLSRKIVTVTFGCLLCLTRPESMVWALVFASILLYSAFRNKRKIYFSVIYLLCSVVTIISLTVFRQKYFGFDLPNTYYAKVSSDRIFNFTEGAKYAINFISGYQAVITFLLSIMMVYLLFALVRLKVLSKANQSKIPFYPMVSETCIITVIIIVGIMLPCSSGGDHFGAFRFYQGLLMLFAWGIIIIGWLFKNYDLYKSSIGNITIYSILIFFLAIGLNDLTDLRNPVKTQLNFEFLLAQEGREMAEKFNDAFTNQKPSVGMIAVGGFGLEYNGETVDLMGLNNVMMGHSPGDRKGIKNHAAFNKDVFYELKPQMLLPVSVENIKEARIEYCNMLSEENFDNLAMKNIFNDENFQKLYSPVYIENKSKTGLLIFVDNNFLSTLKKEQVGTIEVIN